jgi:hypothetical protein
VLVVFFREESISLGSNQERVFCLAAEASFGEIRLVSFPPDLNFGCVIVEDGAMRAEFADHEVNHGGRTEASKFQRFVAPVGMSCTSRNVNDLL